jgi:hypothetical protein
MDATERRPCELSLRRSGSPLWRRPAVEELQTVSDGAETLVSAVDEGLAKSCRRLGNCLARGRRVPTSRGLIVTSVVADDVEESPFRRSAAAEL